MTFAKPQDARLAYHGAPHVQRGAVTRKRLLDAAYSILRDRGHAGLRSASISNISGVSRGGLLHHFPSKDDLITAVLERITAEMEERTRERIRTTKSAQVIPAIVEDARSRFLDDSYRVVLDILLSSGGNKSDEAQRRAMVRRSQSNACRMWAEHLSTDDIAMPLAEEVTDFLWSMAKGLAVRSIVDADCELSDRIVAFAIELSKSFCTLHK